MIGFDINMSQEDPFADIIRGYFLREFPRFMAPGKDLLEVLTSILIGSNQVRYGPAPTPEVQVNIRKVLSAATDAKVPIKMLVPWGGRKSKVEVGVDIAEISALKTVTILQERVRQVYAPGLEIAYRVEDVGAYWLFRTEGTANRYSTQEYSKSFSKLLKVLDAGRPFLESDVMDEEGYHELSGKLASLIYDYLSRGNADSLQILRQSGWVGELPKAQSEFYLSRYRRLYPAESADQHLWRLSDYLGGALARVRLGAVAPNHWGSNYIVLAFVPPIPGSPEPLFSKRLYYRTVPLAQCKTHISAWRAKGYLQIGPGNEVTPKIRTWSEVPELIKNKVTLKNENCEVTVEADYQLV